ncbi:unnamed protein product [Enterobius vermicularis]|uniref:C-type lectin domain-containing protein n=1 Tax=Enterobius vermicularis TaxID=51028 RepID=A0A0N4UVV5_ENTVE|nr:unnamed protein product [Enterobius vermicularis]
MVIGKAVTVKTCPHYPYANYLGIPRMIEGYKPLKSYCFYPVSARVANFYNVNPENEGKISYAITTLWAPQTFNQADEYCQTRFGGQLASFKDARERILLHKAVFPSFDERSHKSLGFLVGLKSYFHAYPIFTDGTDGSYGFNRSETESDKLPRCHGIVRSYKYPIDSMQAVKCTHFFKFVCKGRIFSIPKEVQKYMVDDTTKQADSNDICEEERELLYFFHATKVVDIRDGSSYCIHDFFVSRKVHITDFQEAEELCRTHLGGHLLSISNSEELRFLSGLLFPPLNGSMVELELRPLGLHYSHGDISNFTDGSNGLYAIKEGYKEKNSLDLLGKCFVFVHLYNENRSAIWRSNCKAETVYKRITCKVRNEPISNGKSKRFAASGIGRDSTQSKRNWEQFLIMGSIGAVSGLIIIALYISRSER